MHVGERSGTRRRGHVLLFSRKDFTVAHYRLPAHIGEFEQRSCAEKIGYFVRNSEQMRSKRLASLWITPAQKRCGSWRRRRKRSRLRAIPNRRPLSALQPSSVATWDRIFVATAIKFLLDRPALQERRTANPSWPRVLRAALRGVGRSVDRGISGRG